jgi:hypothetical protein
MPYIRYNTKTCPNLKWHRIKYDLPFKNNVNDLKAFAVKFYLHIFFSKSCFLFSITEVRPSKWNKNKNLDLEFRVVIYYDYIIFPVECVRKIYIDISQWYWYLWYMTLLPDKTDYFTGHNQGGEKYPSYNKKKKG